MYTFVEKRIEKDEAELASWYQKQEEKNIFPTDVILERDIPYMNDGVRTHEMDIYRPKKLTGKFPVIMDFHGGGLITGDRRLNKWFAGEMASRGFIVCSIGYPLVPQRDICGLLRDSYQGVVTAIEMLGEFAGDPDRIYMCGDSAGGFVATYLTAIQNNAKIAKSAGIETKEFRIKALGTISGLFYTGRIDKHGFVILRKYYYGDKFRKNPFWKYVNPENREVMEGLPAIFGVTSKADFLNDNTLKFNKALEKAGKSMKLFYYGDKDELTHDFVIMKPELPETKEVLDNLAKFFNENY